MVHQYVSVHLYNSQIQRYILSISSPLVLSIYLVSLLLTYLTQNSQAVLIWELPSFLDSEKLSSMISISFYIFFTAMGILSDSWSSILRLGPTFSRLFLIQTLCLKLSFPLFMLCSPCNQTHIWCLTFGLLTWTMFLGFFPTNIAAAMLTSAQSIWAVCFWGQLISSLVLQ